MYLGVRSKSLHVVKVTAIYISYPCCMSEAGYYYRMATVTELQAELLAALLNSGISSETVIQAVRALEKQMKPDYGKLDKLVNGNEMGNNYNEATSGADVQNVAPSISELESNGQSIAEQLLR